MIDKPGAYRLSMEEYQSDPCVVPSLTRGTIRDLLYKSPAHVFYGNPRLNPNVKPEPPDSKFDIGTAAHSLILEGKNNILLVEAPDWRTKDSRNTRDDARERGLTPLLVKDYEAVQGIVEAAQSQIRTCAELGIVDLQKDGDAELSYFWEEEGTWMRSRPDWISRDKLLICDLKTTALSANPDSFSKSIVSMGLDIQSSFYRRGVEAVEKTLPKFVFIVVETEAPYLVSFISISPEFEGMAKQKCDFGKFLWDECRLTNRWPGYPSRVCHVDAPGWALASWESTASGIGVFDNE